MIGGEPDVVKRLDPIFRALAPGLDAAPRTPGASGEPGSASSAISIAGRTVPDTSSRWSTTASNTG